jgi:YegS/Rv2252/BmrU family lipid kinase
MDTPVTNENPDVNLQQGSDPAKLQKVFVVMNPVAGLTDAKTAKDLVTSYCAERGWECEIHETEKNEDVTDLVRNVLRDGVDLVIAAGGDGTVSNVVAGMVHSETPLGILPAGTGNALARDLSIPLDLASAMELIGGDHEVHVMDVMHVNEKKYYVLNVSVGISSLTMRTTQRNEKRRFGMLAYFYRAVGSIRHSALHHFRVEVDGNPVRFAASELMVANSKFMGLQPQLRGVNIDPNDGRLDMFIVRAQSLRDYVNVVGGFLRKRNRYGDPTLNHLSARKTIRIESEFPLPVQGDGDMVGNTPVEIHLLPNALRVIAPKKAA